MISWRRIWSFQVICILLKQWIAPFCGRVWTFRSLDGGIHLCRPDFCSDWVLWSFVDAVEGSVAPETSKSKASWDVAIEETATEAGFGVHEGRMQQSASPPNYGFEPVFSKISSSSVAFTVTIRRWTAYRCIYFFNWQSSPWRTRFPAPIWFLLWPVLLSETGHCWMCHSSFLLEPGVWQFLV